MTTRSELLYEISELLQTEIELQEELSLDDVPEWDSLAVIGIISLYDQLFSISLNNTLIKECKTFKDLINLAESSLDK